MARRKIIAGNRKMNKTPSEAVALINELNPSWRTMRWTWYSVYRPSTLSRQWKPQGTNIAIGAENMYFEESGAYTGEIV